MAKKAVYGGRWRRTGDTLGGGGQGDVFSVEDEKGEHQGQWALKRLRRKDRVERFRVEVDILRRAAHPNIIKLIDSKIVEKGDDEASYLVMPISKYGSLDDRLAIYEGHIDSVVAVARQVGAALEYAHHVLGVVHRDVKPGNILFPTPGHDVWLSDFGISLDKNVPRNTNDGEVVGARGFTAPELEIGGQIKVTPDADIYSLGQLIFYMLSGGHKIARENVFDTRYNHLFSKGERYNLLRLLLSRMVTLQPQRIKDMKAVDAELQHIDKWEKTALTAIIDENTRSIVEDLQRQSTQAMQAKSGNEAARKSESEILTAVKGSLLSWLTSELEKVAAFVKAGDALKVHVKPATAFRSNRLNPEHDKTLRSEGGVEIGVEWPDDPHRVEYILQLLLCTVHITNQTKRQRTVRVRDLRLAVLPVFVDYPGRFTEEYRFANIVQYKSHNPLGKYEKGYFGGSPVTFDVTPKHPTSDQSDSGLSTITRPFKKGSCRIVYFRASEWPAVRDTIGKMVSDVFGALLAHMRAAKDRPRAEDGALLAHMPATKDRPRAEG